MLCFTCRCPTYYNLPPQCTLVQQPGQCCLQPVCNFDAKYQTTSGQNVGDLNGNSECWFCFTHCIKIKTIPDTKCT